MFDWVLNTPVKMFRKYLTQIYFLQDRSAIPILKNIKFTELP